MYKEDLVLDNLQWLIGHKNKQITLVISKSRNDHTH